MSETKIQNWIYLIAGLFGLVILTVLIWNGTFKTSVFPLFDNILDNNLGVQMDDTQKDTVRGGWTFVKFAVGTALVFLFFGLVLYGFITVIRKEREDYEY